VHRSKASALTIFRHQHPYAGPQWSAISPGFSTVPKRITSLPQVIALIRDVSSPSISAWGSLQRSRNKSSSCSFLSGTCLFHTFHSRLEASTEILEILAARDLRQENIQPERQLIVVKGSPARILLARLEAERVFPRNHIQQVTPPLELRLGILLSQNNIISSRLLFIPAIPSRFAGKVGRTSTVTRLVMPLKLTDNLSPFSIGPLLCGSRVMERIKSLFMSPQCSKSKNCV